MFVGKSSQEPFCSCNTLDYICRLVHTQWSPAWGVICYRQHSQTLRCSPSPSSFRKTMVQMQLSWCLNRSCRTLPGLYRRCMSQAGSHPHFPAPLPMLYPKIPVLYSDDQTFSYCFLLAGSRQLIAQGFAYIFQIPPQTQQITKEMPRRRAAIIRMSAPSPISMLGEGWGWSTAVFSSI